MFFRTNYFKLNLIHVPSSNAVNLAPHPPAYLPLRYYRRADGRSLLIFNRTRTYTSLVPHYTRRIVRDQVEEAVGDLALEELSLSVGASVTVFSQLVPLLRWDNPGCDRAPDQVRAIVPVTLLPASSYEL